MPQMKRTNFTLDDKTAALLKSIHDSTGATKSEIIRRAVVLYAEHIRTLIGRKPRK